jgi:DNA polymerase-3 subunit epsilon
MRRLKMPDNKTANTELEACASKLEASSNYRVLRKVAEPQKANISKSDQLRYAMIIDTETTGLDLREDEVIELGFILIAYQDAQPLKIVDFGNEMREPCRRIPKIVQELTGITPEMVKGKRVSKKKILNALDLANIVIAHNAAFDRPICERLFSEFSKKPWACSLTEIPWSKYGFESAKLKYLLMDSGHFFEGHRALDDCAALNELLSSRSPSGSSFFSELMESARKPSYFFIVRTPYELRQKMRDLGYRWSSHENRTGGEWQKTVSAENFETEADQILKLKKLGASLEYIEQDAFSRYRCE